MPEATPELRTRMNERFGDPISDTGPIQFLENAGYTLSRQWTWSKPGIEKVEDMTADEFECLVFLVQEWDFGALSAPSAEPDIDIHKQHSPHEFQPAAVIDEDPWAEPAPIDYGDDDPSPAVANEKPSFGKLLAAAPIEPGDIPERDRTPLRDFNL